MIEKPQLLCSACSDFDSCKLWEELPGAESTYSVISCPAFESIGTISPATKLNKNERKSTFKQFEFGLYNESEKNKVIQTRSLNQAIIEFVATCIDPECYVRIEDRLQDDEGNWIKNTDGCQYESRHLLNSDPHILITESEEAEVVEKSNAGFDMTVKRWVKVAEHLLPLSRCVHVDYKNSNRVSGLLANSTQGEATTELSLREPGTQLQHSSKSEILNKRNEQS